MFPISNSHIGQLNKKSSFFQSKFTHIPYHLLILPADLPLPTKENLNPKGPNGFPLKLIETPGEKFYGEVDANNVNNGKGLWECAQKNECYLGNWKDNK